MKPANFAPAYAALYAPLAELTREHGYALAVHGSMARDFDLVCIPWVDAPSSPDAVVEAITKRFAIQLIGEGKPKKHGRVAYTISIEFGECRLDLSFMPCVPAAPTLLTELQRERLEVALATDNAWLASETLREVIGKLPGEGFARSVLRFLLATDARLRGAA